VPDAVSVAELPEQIVPPPVTVTAGDVFTTMETTAVSVHPPGSVPITEYVVDADGATVTLLPPWLMGSQLYVAAPEAVSVAVEPEQMPPPPSAVTLGMLLTVTVNSCVLVQLPLVPVTVYVVVEDGATLMLLPERLPGIQLYVVAPEAESVAELPEQIAPPPVAVNAGEGFTAMDTKAVSVQPPGFVPITVYVVEVAGVTVTLLPEKLPGCQLNVAAPEAVSVEEFPEQMLPPPSAVTLGVLLTVTVTVCVPEQLPEVPVTVYVVVDGGVMLMLLPERLPGCQLYVVAPVALNVVPEPEQIVETPLMESGANEFTVTVTTLVEEQLPFTPVTVYVVVEVGVTVTLLPFRLPGCQV
jgi:hypothetical protein